MYDLKQCNNTENNSEKENTEEYITERSYYKDRLSNSILSTKSSYVPHDDLF
ncbi:MAG: hypothetical protein SPJ62_08880 [Inconstantimicrobium porci]|uniref:hypothetical protein n=1 Tax=Inconstantimicrobium porci TaxID=2652291 RepID=UPI0012B3D352|nr:hypothetical protein [Inconstantimicrobium porci]MDY5912100.1 hypothetical protein [Inconstantimicrobium porci]